MSTEAVERLARALYAHTGLFRETYDAEADRYRATARAVLAELAEAGYLLVGPAENKDTFGASELRAWEQTLRSLEGS